MTQIFKQLLWFQSGKSKFYCSKLIDDEVYRIREFVTHDPMEDGWVYKSDTYMSRIKYEPFIAEKTGLAILMHSDV